jgi:hypothetical protein
MTENQTRPLVVSMKDARRLLDCSPDTLYGLIDTGALDTYLEGQRRARPPAISKIGNHRRAGASPTRRRSRTLSSSAPRAQSDCRK